MRFVDGPLAGETVALPDTLWEQNQRALSDPYALGRIGRYDRIRISDVVSPDAMSVRFSAMSEEAEAEMAAWDDVLHGRVS